jgi:chloride channel protein, CIC family
MYALQNNLFGDLTENIWVVVGLLAGLVVFKIIATSLTIGAGGVGGIIAPVLFMGSAMGHCFALIINNLGFLRTPLSVSNFTMVGMAGLVAGIMHAPLTAIFLIAELTSGYELFVPLMITAAISFMITSQFQQHSVYTLDLAARGELITHNKDQAVLTLLDIRQVLETNFVAVKVDENLGDIVHKGVINLPEAFSPLLMKRNNFWALFSWMI